MKNKNTYETVTETVTQYAKRTFLQAKNANVMEKL